MEEKYIEAYEKLGIYLDEDNDLVIDESTNMPIDVPEDAHYCLVCNAVFEDTEDECCPICGALDVGCIDDLVEE